MDSTPAARVLIIEDQPLVARSLMLMLRKHHPVVAPSLAVLQDVVASVAEGAVVLSDLGIEDGGADGIYDILTAQRPDLLPRLFWLTGGGHNLDRYRETIERSGRPVVLKPMAPAELRTLVENGLEAIVESD